MARSARFGGEFGEQALAVTLADAGDPGQASTGRRLAGLDLRLNSRSHTSPSASRYALIRRRGLLCGVVGRRVRLCGSGAGLWYGHGFGQAHRPAAPADLLHEQWVVSTRAMGAMANTS